MNYLMKKLIYSSAVILVLLIIYLAIRSSSSDIIKPRADSFSANNSPDSPKDNSTINDYDYTTAVDHIGERARISGTVQKIFTSKNGTTFFDYCKNSSNCPFSAVIFAGDKDKFPDLTKYERAVKITGLLKSYQGRAEIVISDPNQIE